MIFWTSIHFKMGTSFTSKSQVLYLLPDFYQILYMDEDSVKEQHRLHRMLFWTSIHLKMGFLDHLHNLYYWWMYVFPSIQKIFLLSQSKKIRKNDINKYWLRCTSRSDEIWLLFSFFGKTLLVLTIDEVFFIF